MFEILVSLMVMSVGMMSLAGLKVAAIKGENESHFRHEASLLMMDLADRMRVNTGGVDSGKYDTDGDVDISAAGEPPTDCEDEACSPDDLALFDLYSIALRVNQALPNSSVSISCPPLDDCTTVAEVEEVRDPVTGLITTAALPAVKQPHTLVLKWEDLKRKDESLTKVVNGESKTSVRNEREISLTIFP